MKLSFKIYGVVATVLTMMLAVAGVAIYSMNSIGVLLVEIAEEDIPLTTIVAEITVNQLEQALWLERAIGAAEVNMNSSARMLESEHEFERLAGLVDEELKTAEALADKGAALAHNAEAAQKFVEVGVALREIEASHSAFDKHALELFEAFLNLTGQFFIIND